MEENALVMNNMLCRVASLVCDNKKQNKKNVNSNWKLCFFKRVFITELTVYGASKY